ncbi:MAG: arginine--tRNA ligase [Gammaproteobacteria bacterium]|nr:arginine--tRNA ligase [Gammaproteobacteria bacterium]
MKHALGKLVAEALQRLHEDGILSEPFEGQVQITHTKNKDHGDFACNVAMQLAKLAKRNPREIAQALIERLPAMEALVKTEIAGPGFINFFIDPSAGRSVIGTVLESGEAYGRSEVGKGQRVQVEFVSANPTGPLHVGHGRGAAYGATVADLLEAIGCEVHREYYVNDAGRQMDILATSVWLRYLELAGEELIFPSNGYKGDYVWDIGATLHREHGDDYRHSIVEVYEGVPADEPEGGDKEEHIDALIAKAKHLLGDNRYRYVFELGLNTILDNIRADLEAFGVTYEEWYSERGLTESGLVNKMLERLRDSGHVYEKDGALWFKSSDFGDEKDRVVQRDNGQTTYFASDIAYHMEKLERGFDHVIDVWGADHHGYVPRVRAALKALGDDDSKLEVLLVQFANLYSQGEKMQMSTRSGEFVTLRELRQEVGADAARFFYVMRKCEQHLDFDLDLAKSQSSDNPVYYIQYAHARIHSVLRQLDEKGMSHDVAVGAQHLELLTESHEEDLINRLGRFPEVVESAALNREPHQLVHFLRDLANAFHTYYNAHQFLVEAEELRSARLNLCLAARQVLSNGLRLLGVSAPEEM